MKILSLLIVLLLLTGCASIEKIDDNVVFSETEKAEYAGKSIEELLVYMNKLLDQARLDELTIYAPRHYALASDEAKITSDLAGESSDSAARKKVLLGVAKTRRYLEKAAHIKETVLRELQDVYENKLFMVSQNIPHDYPGDYERILKDIDSIIKYYELGNEKAAVEVRVKLLVTMKRLQGTAVIDRRLKEARTMMEKVEDENLDDYAPQSFSLAKSSLAHAKKTIMNNPRDVASTDAVSNEATILSKHVYHVGQAVIALQKIKQEEMEIIILDEEERLMVIAKSLNARDVRDLDLDQQAKALAVYAEQLQTKLTRPSQLLREKDAGNDSVTDNTSNETRENAPIKSDEKSSVEISDKVSGDVPEKAAEDFRPEDTGSIEAMDEAVDTGD
jgi:hypothetical protein